MNKKYNDSGIIYIYLSNAFDLVDFASFYRTIGNTTYSEMYIFTYYIKAAWSFLQLFKLVAKADSKGDKGGQ